MKGTIATKDKCAKCGKHFQPPFECCSTEHPHRFFIDVSVNGKRFKIYRDPKGERPFASQAAAEAYLGHLRYEQLRPKTRQPMLPFEDYAAEWLDSQEASSLAQNTIRTWRTAVGNLLRYFHTYDIFASISQHEIRHYYIHMARMDMAPKTIQVTLGVLRMILKDAYEKYNMGEVPKFPHVRVSQSNDWKLLTEEAQDRVISCVEDPVYRLAILFMARQMVRPSEVRALQWDDISYVNHSVQIRRTFSGTQLKATTKTRRSRNLPLHPEIEEALRALPNGMSGDEFVFRKDGNPLGINTLREAWYKACKKAGIEGVRFYAGTRHSSATHALSRGIQERQIMEFLGHTTSVMTARYAKVTTEKLREVLRPSPQSGGRHVLTTKG